MKKVIMILGILIGAVSCASRYDCTEVRVENSDAYRWNNGEMSDEEYSKKHPDLWMTDEEWDSL